MSASRRSRLAACVLAALLLAAREAGAETRTLGGLDDARACALPEAGGVVVATGGGLGIVGADGRAQVLTARDGLPETRVHAVAVDGDALWVGTEAGAAKIVGGRVVRTVGHAPVHAVARASGGVLLGTWGEGLVLASGDRVTSLVPASAAKRIDAVASRAGDVVIALAGGSVMILSGGVLRPVRGPGEASGPDEGTAHVQALLPLGGGALLAGGLAGLTRLEAAGARAQLSTADVRSLALGDGGEVLVATWGQGLLALPARAPSPSARPAALAPALGLSPEVREVRAVATRGRARCVATTSGAWLDRGDGVFARVSLGEATLPSSDVTAVAVEPAGARVAVGTFDRGAVLVLASGGAARPIPGIGKTDTVNALAWEGDRLWVATAQGLVRVAPDGATRRFTPKDGLPNPMTRAILVDAAGVIVGTDEGPALVRGDDVVPLEPRTKGRPSTLASPMHATWALAKAPDGALLVGTTSGLYRVRGAWAEAGGMTVTRASVANDALDDDWVTALAVTGDDVLVGTYAHGVTRLRDGAGAGGMLAARAVRLGGGYVNPAGLALFGGRAYVATMDGLLVRELASPPETPWALVQGVAPGRDVTGVASRGSELWVASRRGLGITSAAAVR
jgi:ligand-binding sensor domain-containing protein